MIASDIIRFDEVDIVFTSEAELAISSFARGKKLSQIDGIVYRDSGKIIEQVATNYIKNIDEIPFPDYGLFNISDYHLTKGITKRHPHSFIITSRGCPYQCTFCSSKTLNPTDKKAVRFRSPENVLAEIELLVKKYGVKELSFSDDMFTGNKSHLFGICEGLIKARHDLVWMCMTHVNNIDREKLRIMKRSGCHQICFGVESGDQEIQKIICKNLDFKRVREAVQMTKAEKIDVRCSFMFGNQYETSETMQRTIDFAKSISPDFASFNIATPFPGTYLRTWAIENGYLQNSSYEALDSTAYTMVTPALPPGKVEEYCNKAFKSFYYRPRYIMQRLLSIRDAEDVVRCFKSAYYAIRAIGSIFKAKMLAKPGKRQGAP